MTTALCPNCGVDLARDEPITRGAIAFDPRGEVRWHGEPVQLSPAERSVLGTLLKAGGRFIGAEVVCERIGYDGDDQRNMVSVYVHRLRRKLAFEAIETQHGVGWRWAA